MQKRSTTRKKSFPFSLCSLIQMKKPSFEKAAPLIIKDGRWWVKDCKGKGLNIIVQPPIKSWESAKLLLLALFLASSSFLALNNPLRLDLDGLGLCLLSPRDGKGENPVLKVCLRLLRL